MFDIKFEHVTVKYGDNEALKDITVELKDGKIYGLIGRNGAGKTTLLSLLASFMEPASGKITVNGQEPFENAEIMSEINFIYEKDYKEESDNVKGLLEAAERYRPNFDKEFAHELVRRFNLPLDKPVKSLSRGMQSALNVTIGLASRTAITIFDEAYLGMDAPTREIFYKAVLEDYAKHPRTIILSTHLVSEMDYLFEEVVILHKGRILLKEPVEELLEKAVSFTGAKEKVDELTSDMRVLHTQELGGVKRAFIYGKLSEEKKAKARELGLEVESSSLQDLFIQLTSEENEHEI